MKENDNKFSVSTIMESIKNSRRLIPFLFLVAGTFFPIAVIAFDKVLYPHLHSLLFAMLLASIFGGWIVRYIFILYDMIMGNIRFRPVIISAIIFFVAALLIMANGWQQNFLNNRMADENYSLDAMAFYLMMVLNVFPMVVFFFRTTNVKKEALCLVLTVALCLLGSLPLVFFTGF